MVISCSEVFDMKKLTVIIALLLSCTLLTGAITLAAEENSTPIAENLEITTYRGVSVGGRLSASDPDGDALSYQITTAPTKGSIDLDDDGHFVYTPADGKRGKDYFGYKASDKEGNLSQEATVIIRIEKQKSKVTYSDLDGKSCAYAAVRLAENNIFTGERYGNEYIFASETPMTRSEFLALCIEITGVDINTNTLNTGFSDDDSIEVWAKPYVYLALKRGIISGYAENDVAVFEPQRQISVAEAIVILDRAVQLTDAVAAWFSTEDAVPTWAAQSVANVASCGILPHDCSVSGTTLSRAQAAEMLSGAMDIINRR